MDQNPNFSFLNLYFELEVWRTELLQVDFNATFKISVFNCLIF